MVDCHVRAMIVQQVSSPHLLQWHAYHVILLLFTLLPFCSLNTSVLSIQWPTSNPQLLVCPILALTPNVFCVLSCIAHVEEKLGQSLIVQITTALWECLWWSCLFGLWLSNPLTLDCSRGVNWDRVLSCNLQLHFESICDGPITGLSNPCLDTQRLLCLVMYCSHGGEIGTESHRANYDCTLRVSVMVLPLRLSNPLTMDCSWGVNWDKVLLCNLQLHFESICDWPNYWSVQSLAWHPTSSVSCHVLLTWRRNWDRVSSCNLQLHFKSVCDSLCYSGCSILWQRIAQVVNWMRQSLVVQIDASFQLS
jgi:hypothetical protein